MGDYDLQAEAGRGGASVVYRARHRVLNRTVALKALHGNTMVSGEAFERFRIEANAVARLDHPNIAPLFETGRDGGVHFLVLRWFERGSLANLLQTRRFSSQEAARLLITVARAVHYAHQRGVLHRDLKPSNLLIDEEGAPHITDFGLAKIFDDESTLTLSSSVLGTPNYMAPEQADGRARQVAVPADIYSLGAILFELLTGRPPFVGENPLAVLRKLADDEPPRPRSLNPEIDRDLEAICLRCLEKQPDARYASAAALADDLERWLNHEPISIRPPGTVERSLKWARRRPLVTALAALALLAFVTGATGTLWQWNTARKVAEAARLDSYVTAMDLAQRIHKQNPAQAKAILDRHRPQRGQTDLRGWEWRYLWQACREDKPLQYWQGPKPLIWLALSDDEHFAAVGERRGGVKVIDTTTFGVVYETPPGINEETAPFHAYGNTMAAAVVSIPKTPLLAWSETTGSANTVVRLWNSQTRETTAILPQPYVVRNMAATADGKRLIVSCQTRHGGTLVWDIATGTLVTEVRRRASHFSRSKLLSVSPDGRLMTVEDAPGHLLVVEIETGKVLWRFDLEESFSLASAFSPDGKTLAAGAGFGFTDVQLWSLETGERAKTLQAEGWATRILFTPGGEEVIAAGADQAIRIWNLETGERRRTFRLPAEVADLALSSDGTKLFAVDATGRLSRWDTHQPPDQPLEGKLPLKFQYFWHFLPDSQGIIGITTNRMIAEAGLGWSRVYEGGPTNALSVTIAPDGQTYVAGGLDGSVTLRRRVDHQILRSFTGLTNPIIRIRLLPLTRRLIAFQIDGDLLLWNLDTGEELLRASVSGAVLSEDCTPDQKVNTIVSFEGLALSIDTLTGLTRRKQMAHSEAISFAYSRDGRLAVTSGVNIPVRLYRASDLAYLRDIGEGRSDTPFVAVFSADGRRVATGGGNVQLIDTGSGRHICFLTGPEQFAHSMLFSPDGNALARTSEITWDVYFWRVPSWEEINRIEAAGEY